MKLVRAMSRGAAGLGNGEASKVASELEAASKAACDRQRERTQARRWGLVRRRVLRRAAGPTPPPPAGRRITAAGLGTLHDA